MTTHAITLTNLLLYRAHQIASIWHLNNEVPSLCALRSPSQLPLSLSHFSCALSLSASQLYLKDHLLDPDSSCDFQVSIFWPWVGVLTLLVSARAGLPFSLNEFISPVWDAHRHQLSINHFAANEGTALSVRSNRLEPEEKKKRWIITSKHCMIHLLNRMHNHFRLYISCTITHLHLLPLDITSHKSTSWHIWWGTKMHNIQQRAGNSNIRLCLSMSLSRTEMTDSVTLSGKRKYIR